MVISLQKLHKDDVPLFLKWWKDKAIIKLTSGRYEKSDKVLEKYFLNMLADKKASHFIVRHGGKKIGHVSLCQKGKTITEISAMIGEKQYWGKGYGTQAIKMALSIAFVKLKCKKVILHVRPENKRAIRAYEKCGFIKQGIIKYPKNKYLPVVIKMYLDKAAYDKRDRAVGIIIKNKNILLIHRIKNGKEYYVYPGGGVKQGECPEKAMYREIKEEACLVVKKAKFLFQTGNRGNDKYYFLVTKFTGKPKLGGEEKERMSKDNQYYLEWISLNEFYMLKNVFPVKAKKLLK